MLIYNVLIVIFCWHVSVNNSTGKYAGVGGVHLSLSMDDGLNKKIPYVILDWHWNLCEHRSRFLQ